MSLWAIICKALKRKANCHQQWWLHFIFLHNSPVLNELCTQRSIIFSIPHFMNGGFWGHQLNQWVNTSPTTPLPGLCTSGEILLYMTSLSVSKISPDVQRPGSGVVGLVLTHWLTWCPQNPPFINFYLEKNGPLCYIGYQRLYSTAGQYTKGVNLLTAIPSFSNPYCPMSKER